MKREAITHTKMKRLSRLLNLAPWQSVGLMESLWHLTAREAPRGDIGKLTDEDIALAIDYRQDAGEMMAALAAAGWLDQNPDHRYVIHGWSEHCEDSVHMRLARGRQFFANGQAPKLIRLGGQERAAAEAFYTPSAQKPDPCAQPEEPCAQVAEIEPVRTPSAPPIQSITYPIQSNPSPGLTKPTPDRCPPLLQKPAKDGGRVAVVVTPEIHELRETLGLWTCAYPHGVTDNQLREIVGELNGAPVRAFVAHLDGMNRCFQPGGKEEPTKHGFFKSTARNFATAYGPVVNGCHHGLPDGTCVQCLPKAKYDELTEAF